MSQHWKSLFGNLLHSPQYLKNTLLLFKGFFLFKCYCFFKTAWKESIFIVYFSIHAEDGKINLDFYLIQCHVSDRISTEHHLREHTMAKRYALQGLQFPTISFNIIIFTVARLLCTHGWDSFTAHTHTHIHRHILYIYIYI